MKRLKNLITGKSITIGFCIRAIQEAAKRKTKRENVQKVLNNIEDYAHELQDMILNETFEPCKYTYEVRIEHGKKRYLQKSKFFPDQCMHHALIILIRPKLEKRIDPLAVASIPNRGQALGIKAIEKVLRKKKSKRLYKYCGKGDIKKCFESIKPQVVMDCFRKMIKDERYLRLFGKVVYSYDSLPLGNYMSAWILNILLKPMDERIRAQDGVTFYVRFMDDFAFFSPNKRKARRLKKIVIEELTKLKLQLKHDYKLFVIDINGIDMMGYRFFRNTTILRRRNLKKIYRQLYIMSKQKYYSVYYCQSIVSRLGMCRHCNSKYIWKISGKIIDMYRIKNIISESSREYYYNILGKTYKAKMLLI